MFLKRTFRSIGDNTISDPNSSSPLTSCTRPPVTTTTCRWPKRPCKPCRSTLAFHAALRPSTIYAPANTRTAWTRLCYPKPSNTSSSCSPIHRSWCSTWTISSSPLRPTCCRCRWASSPTPPPSSTIRTKHPLWTICDRVPVRTSYFPNRYDGHSVTSLRESVRVFRTRGISAPMNFR